MKKLLTVLLVFVLMAVTACAVADGDRITGEEYTASACAAYPGWEVLYDTWYGSGSFEGRMA